MTFAHRGFEGAEYDNRCNIIAEWVRSALDTHFPPSGGTVVIAEPGEFFSTSPYTLAVKVVAKRTRQTTIDGMVQEQHDVYVNESTENCVPRDMYTILDIRHSPLNYEVLVSILTRRHRPCKLYRKITARKKFSVFQPPHERPRNQVTTLWGATCHPFDVFEDGVPFFDVSVGEWLLMDNVGAYGMVKACGFNGCGIPPVHYRTRVMTWNGCLASSRPHGFHPAIASSKNTCGTHPPR
ncbi:hypothetical protein HPB48_009561 [Haemaphysalis longicornis]|uniref:Orn/DAP/Arg decarboxylase 2 C-terminal domain-containing protein n=1 Tax=Haemaphysalis longicornis TaxID=44386 RepID=A0A9J6G1F1_HAELO|nr:hypothetical protein HPB48_009561 [Haemaphysalis longicornis]